PEALPDGDLLLRSALVPTLQGWADPQGARQEGHELGGGGLGRRGRGRAPRSGRLIAIDAGRLVGRVRRVRAWAPSQAPSGRQVPGPKSGPKSGPSRAQVGPKSAQVGPPARDHRVVAAVAPQGARGRAWAASRATGDPAAGPPPWRRTPGHRPAQRSAHIASARTSTTSSRTNRALSSGWSGRMAMVVTSAYDGAQVNSGREHGGVGGPHRRGLPISARAAAMRLQPTVPPALSGRDHVEHPHALR